MARSVNPGVNLPYQLGVADLSRRPPGITTSCPARSRPICASSWAKCSTSRWATMRWRCRPAPRSTTSSAIRSRRSCTTIPACRSAYILKADLRIDGGMFEQNLQNSADITTGRLDTRFSGPAVDPLNKEADYDPQSAAISSAYISGVQRLCAHGAEIWRRKEIPPVRAAERLGPQASAARISLARCRAR